jgi:surface protein
LPPIHWVLARKENNAGKLDSHAWFFQTFVEHLKPNYRILIDVKTVCRCLQIADDEDCRDTKIAGVCMELTTHRSNFCQVTVAVQHFEYKMFNILHRSTGSAFGFINVLPGEFSAYQHEAVKTKEHPLTEEPEGPLVRYCQTLTTPMHQLGAFLGNMHLPEDRMLCPEIVARPNEWRTMHSMHYCKGAVAKTDVPKTIEGLIRKHHRWLNETFFAAVYAVMHFPRVVNSTVHSAVRKFFSWECVFIATVLMVTWMFLSFWMVQFVIYLSFWMARRHGALLLLVVISLPGIDAMTSLWPEPSPRQERALSAYTQLTDSNIKTAANSWVSNQTSATSTYGLVHTWDLSQVASLESVWCGYNSGYCGSAYEAKRSFNGDISSWDVSKVTSMYLSKSTCYLNLMDWWSDVI